MLSSKPGKIVSRSQEEIDLGHLKRPKKSIPVTASLVALTRYIAYREP
jgi:hypothetical protein